MCQTGLNNDMPRSQCACKEHGAFKLCQPLHKDLALICAKSHIRILEQYAKEFQEKSANFVKTGSGNANLATLVTTSKILHLEKYLISSTASSQAR